MTRRGGWERIARAAVTPQDVQRDAHKARLRESARPPRRPRKRRRKESSIEESCRVEAIGEGWTTRKMNGFGFRAWPDRLFIKPRKRQCCRNFWVEFKRPGEEPTVEQARMHADLRARGETVYVCDTKEKFRAALKAQSA